jgi:hypothetical protein
MSNLYDKSRHPWELEPYYSRHISAMTSEDLYSKADIAQELAFRDQQNEVLRRILIDIIEQQGIEHEVTDCPEDDTCCCANIFKVNRALGR